MMEASRWLAPHLQMARIRVFRVQVKQPMWPLRFPRVKKRYAEPKQYDRWISRQGCRC
jgi:hypothetical protein